MSRRKSTISIGRIARPDTEKSAALVLEQLEQETTLVLQEIDRNLSTANAVINDKIFPILKRYSTVTDKVLGAAGFWKTLMEEAADVQFSPCDTNTAGEKEAQNLPPAAATGDTPQSSLDEIDALTPQLRPRTLVLLDRSPQVLTVPGASRGLTVLMSPRKKTPQRTPTATPARPDDRRSSILQNFLNSSPTLPEPPVLVSDVGRQIATSSSVQRVPNSRDYDAGRVSPGLLPLALTPGLLRESQSPQRFPRTPTFGSASRRSDRLSGRLSGRLSTNILPIKRVAMDDTDLPEARTVLRDDESDELPVPKLLRALEAAIQNLGRDFGVASAAAVDLSDTLEAPRLVSTAPLRKKIRTDDELENVFLDDSGRGSRLFDDVVPLDHANSPAHEDGEKGENFAQAGEFLQESAQTQDAPSATVAAAHNVSPDHPHGPSRDNTHTLTSANTSDIGQALGERWRLLTRSLQK